MEGVGGETSGNASQQDMERTECLREKEKVNKQDQKCSDRGGKMPLERHLLHNFVIIETTQ